VEPETVGAGLYLVELKLEVEGGMEGVYVEPPVEAGGGEAKLEVPE